MNVPLYIKQIVLVGAGGFIGASARFVLAGWVHRAASRAMFPVGTLAVNVIGCLLIGYLGGEAEVRGAMGPGTRLFLLIGVLGGFTTFSTFAYETLELGLGAQFARVLVNVAAHVILGLAAAWLGYVGARYT